MKKYFQENNLRRQKLVSFESSAEVMKNKDGIRESTGIVTVEQLRVYLQEALRIEHATIPPYLCALYSIEEGTNVVPAAIIRSVVVEEMLHMILVANILNAVGGAPEINTEKFMINYPDHLPRSNKTFKIGLLKFSKEAMRGFLKIEKAAESDTPQADNFNTIGQFYNALREGLIFCEDKFKGIFTGDVKRQVTGEHYYGSGGSLNAITSLKDALLAIDEIVGQGEGIDGSISDSDDVLFGDDIEYAHYFRFNEVLQERFYQNDDKPHNNPSGKKMAVDWNAIYNMEPNPKMANYPQGSDLWNKSFSFNKTYMVLLDNINAACNGKPELLMQGIALMYELKYQAIELMKIPTGKGDLMAGPSFEFVSP